MNWDAIAFDWNQARAFLATAEEGSLSAAARVLGLTQPTLGRQVTALEDALGVVLFERAGRSMALTPTGRDLLDHVKAMAEAAGAVSLVASGQAQAVEGVVSLSVVDLVATFVLPDILKDLGKIAPGIEIDIVATNALSDLRQREADIAIRHVRPDDPDLIGKLVREQKGQIYAAKSYIARHGRPETVEDIANATFVGYGNRDELVRYFAAFGIPIRKENIRYNSANGMVAWAMVREGLGVGPMSDDIAAYCPEVEPLLPSIEPIRFPLWLVTHRELHTSKRIRIVFDHLAERL